MGGLPVKDAKALTKPSDVVLPDQLEGNHIHISFEAAEAIGRVIHPILISPRVTRRLKNALLEVALTTLRDVEQLAHLAPLAMGDARTPHQPIRFPSAEKLSRRLEAELRRTGSCASS
jgi:hypothetical protein